MYVTFAEWQPAYAEHGIATFPVMITPDNEKKPMTTNWPNVGLKGSADLARKFPDAAAFGFLQGPRTGITLVDIDRPDEKLVADAQDLYGKTPLIVRTGSGNGFHLYYKFDGERRHVDTTRKVDILGDGGYAVAFPSRGSKRYYEIIEGTLDDLARLPVKRVPANENTSPAGRGLVPALRDGDGRNVYLFDAIRPLALQAETEGELFKRAMDINQQFAEPQSVNAVTSTVKRVWGYKLEGTLLVPGCEARMFLSESEWKMLHGKFAAQSALMYLRMKHGWRGRGEPFFLANAIAASIGIRDLAVWRRVKKLLAECGLIKILHKGGGGPNDPPIACLC